MAKRRLTQQQKRRIQDKTQASTSTAQDKALSQLDTQRGVIVAHFGHQCEVEDEHGHSRLCHVRANLPQLVTGDEVLFVESADRQAVVCQYFPRRSLLRRSLKSGQEKLIAANVDLAVITVAAKPSFSLQLIDRYLINTHRLNISALIVINKMELFSAKMLEETQQRLALYEELGAELFWLSCESGDGVPELLNRLKGCNCVFIGQSGVGKSSIIQQALPDTSINIGAISASNETGKHTTTNARRYHLKNEACLIDSPGIRDLPLGHLTQKEIAQGFVEFTPLIPKCKFSNCSHQHEPGCAIENGIKLGKVYKSRYESYLNIVQDSVG